MGVGFGSEIIEEKNDNKVEIEIVFEVNLFSKFDDDVEVIEIYVTLESKDIFNQKKKYLDDEIAQKGWQSLLRWLLLEQIQYNRK